MNVRAWIVVGLGAAVTACGGGSSDGGEGSCNPTLSTGFTLTAAGVTPKAACVLPGGTVTFTNNDTASHDIQNTGGACPQLNVGTIAPAQQKSATFPNIATCTFHDAANATNANFAGTLAVNNAMVSGPGY